MLTNRIGQAFNKVTVLYEGRQIYFGHKDAAKKYFTDLGYHCPDRETTADFLTSLTNPLERVVEPGFESKVPRTPVEFAGVWKQSAARAQLLREIKTFEEAYPMQGHQLKQLKAARKTQQASFTSVAYPSSMDVAKFKKAEQVSLYTLYTNADRSLHDSGIPVLEGRQVFLWHYDSCQLRRVHSAGEYLLRPVSYSRYAQQQMCPALLCHTVQLLD